MAAGMASQAIATIATSVGIGFATGVCQQVDIIADAVNLRASRNATLLDMERGIAILSILQETEPILRDSFIIMEKMILGLKEPPHI